MDLNRICSDPDHGFNVNSDPEPKSIRKFRIRIWIRPPLLKFSEIEAFTDVKVLFLGTKFSSQLILKSEFMYWYLLLTDKIKFFKL